MKTLSWHFQISHISRNFVSISVEILLKLEVANSKLSAARDERNTTATTTNFICTNTHVESQVKFGKSRIMLLLANARSNNVRQRCIPAFSKALPRVVIKVVQVVEKKWSCEYGSALRRRTACIKRRFQRGLTKTVSRLRCLGQD